ncbi:MAG: hypothetical protein ABH818_02195 [Patescibacteria group bacterium]|nr:hypothetical protein [Patescibacteria group bacterium]MBU1870973.1 hypothetical protein [Patescibacteria group bacterium]
MEKTFITIFILGILVYSLLIVGIFLFICKLILLTTSQINILGLTIS